MLQLILFFVLNFLGFLVFHQIWLWLDKPEPYDYTTIPGLKCEELGLTKAEIQLPKTAKLSWDISTSAGNLDVVNKFANVHLFLRHLFVTFGSLAAFHWGARYVVNVGDLETLVQLKEYKKWLDYLTENALTLKEHHHSIYNNVLVMMFEEEIELNAHPIPARIPLLIDLKMIAESSPRHQLQWLETFLRIK
ncbi:unnamed protein product [Bursaphelenchus okinawaensis]|uniref:Uncharacterized protein n=1 Tax=Bursaphelenchus okinawaensis TaxID=465554 RepID=A0A811KQQ6_9BILA|nr:unnamed protein product [Bursaphelenchus okinawaensis]CAG9107660.1 unnamed protein product [Bursaphelenchus okinawaensis]